MALVALWQSMLAEAPIPDTLTRDIRALRPRSWTDGVLTLHAPAHLAKRRSLADALLARLAPVAPVELREVRLTNGS